MLRAEPWFIEQNVKNKHNCRNSSTSQFTDNNDFNEVPST